MAVETEINEKYWTWCKVAWRIKRPCRKTRTVTRWCYQFSIWKQNKFLSLTNNKACENDIEYSWRKWNDWNDFGVGSVTYTNVEKCFSNKMEGRNGCNIIDVGNDRGMIN